MASATAALALCSLLKGGQLVAQLRQAADGARFLEISLTGMLPGTAVECQGNV